MVLRTSAALALVFATTATAHAASFSKMSVDELTQVLLQDSSDGKRRKAADAIKDRRLLEATDALADASDQRHMSPDPRHIFIAENLLSAAGQ